MLEPAGLGLLLGGEEEEEEEGGGSPARALSRYRAALVMMMMMMTASTSDFTVFFQEGRQEGCARRRLSPRDSPNNPPDVRAGEV